MATKLRGDYRTINASFWDDPDVQAELTPEARLAFAVLRTCQSYGLAGIFRYYLATFRAQAGLTVERGWSDNQALGLFTELERAGYLAHDAERSVVWIIDGLRWDPHVSLAHARQRAGVLAQLRSLPRTRLLLPFLDRYNLLDLEEAEDLATRARESVNDPASLDDHPQLEAFPRLNLVDTEISKRDGPPTPTPTPTLTPTPKPTPSAKPSPPAPPAAAHEKRDEERRLESQRLLDELIGNAEELEAGGGTVAALYFAEAERGLVDYYATRGGRWTPTRRRNLLSQLKRYDLRAALAGLEVYADKHAGAKDERFLAGIARRMERDLGSPQGRKEFDRELARHRKSAGAGVFSQAQEELDERRA